MGSSELSDHISRSAERYGPCIARVWSAFLSALVVVSLANCAPLPEVTEEQRNQLGVVGVVSVNFRPEDQFSTPMRGRVTGVATGAAAGALEAASALGAGDCTGAGPFCGLVLLVEAAVIVGGAVYGGIVGGLHAVPEDKAREIESRIIEVLSTAQPQESLLRQVIEAAREEGIQPIFEPAVQGPAMAEENLDYRRLMDAGVDTVLEIGVVTVGLAGAGGGDPELVLFLQARARLIRAESNTELYSHKTITYQSGRRKFTEWGADGARLMRENLERGYRVLAERIIDQVFLEVRWN